MGEKKDEEEWLNGCVEMRTEQDKETKEGMADRRKEDRKKNEGGR